MTMAPERDQRPVVEERGHLLPGRRDLPRLRRRRRRRLRRADPPGRLPGRARRHLLWLMPFYPSPNRDDGYDVSDYFGVDERLGSPGGLRRVRAHGQRPRDQGDRRPGRQPHLRPASLVPVRARRPASRRYRYYYVWRDEPSDEPKGIAFPDRETSNWQRDRKAGQYYLHRFYRHQPDLNVANPAVRDEIAKIVGYWLELGRRRASAWTPSRSCSRSRGSSARSRATRTAGCAACARSPSRRRGEAMLLGEVNTALQDLARYFGDEDGDALQHAVRLHAQPAAVAVAGARGGRAAGVDASAACPRCPPDNAWTMFLRNHDELSLDKLTGPQREEVFAAFGPDPGHAALRPRPAPAHGDDARRRRPAAAHGLEPDAVAARHAGDLHGRRDRDGREPRHPRPHERARADAVVATGRNGGFSSAAQASDLVRPMAKGASAPST